MADNVHCNTHGNVIYWTGESVWCILYRASRHFQERPFKYDNYPVITSWIYGWLWLGMCFAPVGDVFFVRGFSWGISIVVFGVVSGALITRYGLHRVTLVSSILVPLGFLLSFFATSVEYMYACIGIVAGIGNSMGFISSVVAIGRVFTGPKMALCLAIHSSSIAAGGLLYPYLIDLLLSQFGLRGAFLVLAAVQSNACAFSVMCWINKDQLNEFNMRSNKSEETTNMSKEFDQRTAFENKSRALESYTPNSELPRNMKLDFDKGNGGAVHGDSNETETTWRKFMITFIRKLVLDFRLVLGSKIFVFILVSFGFTMASAYAYLGLLLDISIWKGLTDKQGLFLFVVYNISGGIARLLPGLLKQTKGFSLFILPICSSLVGCISGLLLNFGTNYTTYVTSICMIGIASGGTVSSITMILIKVFPRKQVPVATGLLLTLNGIMTTAIGPIFGKLRDATGSYSSVLLTISVIYAIGVVLYSTALVLRRREIGKKSVDAPKPSVFTITKF